MDEKRFNADEQALAEQGDAALVGSGEIPPKPPENYYNNLDNIWRTPAPFCWFMDKDKDK